MSLRADGSRSLRHFVMLPLLLALPCAAGCGAKSGLSLDGPTDSGPTPVDVGPDVFVPPPDTGPDSDPIEDAMPDTAPDAMPDAPPDAMPDAGCIPADDGCGVGERCGNGADDDCDGEADEGCACIPGEVQACFIGPPGRRGLGSCEDGTQTCLMSRTWGTCEGGISPREDLCNGLDNLCNGCSQQEDCEISCPGPDDPRVPTGTPLNEYRIDGRDFYPGLVSSWRWRISGGPCDTISPRFQSFELSGARTRIALFNPRLSGDYTVTLTIVTEAGTTLQCEWIVHVAGPGLRVEMCYPESETEDLDLFLKQPDHPTTWYLDTSDANHPALDQCGWHNCEAYIRGSDALGNPVPRVDWGYDDSPLSECIGGPLGERWAELGHCTNPRLDIDNNLAEGTGLPENINIDSPRDSETFRVMVMNWSGGTCEPLVNIYCDGRRVATYGAPPDIVPGFEGIPGTDGIGAMWRVVDVTTHVDAAGEVTCDVTQLHGDDGTGYHVTWRDITY